MGVGLGVGLLELLLGEGLASRHQPGSVPEQFPHSRKDRKGASKPRRSGLSVQSRESPGSPDGGRNPGASFSGDSNLEYYSKNRP